MLGRYKYTVWFKKEDGESFDTQQDDDEKEVKEGTVIKTQTPKNPLTSIISTNKSWK